MKIETADTVLEAAMQGTRGGLAAIAAPKFWEVDPDQVSIIQLYCTSNNMYVCTHCIGIYEHMERAA